MTVIDVHTHFLPSFVAAEGALGTRSEDGWLAHPEGYRYPLHKEFFDVSAKLEQMDSTEIELSVLSITPTLFFYESDADEAVEFAKRANDSLAEMVGESDRLLGFAHLPLQAPEEAAKELDRCIGELGFRGAHIGTSYNGGKPLDGAELDPLWKAADRHGLPLVLHPYYVGSKPGLEDFYLTNTLGNPIDTTVAGSRLLHADTFDRFQNVPVVLVHAGGFLPFQVGRLDHAHAQRQEPRKFIEDPPSSRLGRLWMDTITHSDESLEFLHSRIGPDRIVLGTDIPFDMADADPLKRVRRAKVDEDAIGATAAALLRL
jgi:aminocarboxymuconate-semialdehyde decarboxylase